MTHLLTLLLLSVIPQDCVARDDVSALESNRIYSGDSSFILRQFCGLEADNHYRFWKMQPDAGIRVWRDHAHGGWCAIWQDGDVTRVVRAASYYETWTGFDPELEDRTFLPADQRRELRHVKSRCTPLP